MNIYIGADHRGFALKQDLLLWLTQEGHTVTDCGNTILDPNDDYPDVAIKVGEAVSQDRIGLGIVLCGSGGGVCIAVNKVMGIRAGVARTQDEVKSLRNDDHINVVALGADGLDLQKAKDIISTFMTTNPSQEERHKRRIDKVFDYEFTKMMGSGCGGSCGCGH